MHIHPIIFMFWFNLYVIFCTRSILSVNFCYGEWKLISCLVESLKVPKSPNRFCDKFKAFFCPFDFSLWTCAHQTSHSQLSYDQCEPHLLHPHSLTWLVVAGFVFCPFPCLLSKNASLNQGLCHVLCTIFTPDALPTLGFILRNKGNPACLMESLWQIPKTLL